MVFGAILAGGIGSRMGTTDKPKQFIEIGGKPIIVYTVEVFCNNRNIDKVIILCPDDWIEYTRDIFAEYPLINDKAVVISGGEKRNDTIMNAVSYIEEHYGIDEESLIVTHDAVRPFVTQRIINDNIKEAGKADACDTVIAATDTIVQSADGVNISDIPDRSKLYQGQTPQTFNAGAFKDLYNSMTDAEKGMLTDAAKVFLLKGKNVCLVKGETTNIKVTYPSDLRLAEAILGGKNEK